MSAHRFAKSVCLICLVGSLGLARPAGSRADFVLSIPNVTLPTGALSGSFDVLIQNKGTSAVAINSFSFEIAGPSAVTFVDATTATASANPYLFAGMSSFGPTISFGTPFTSTLQAADLFSSPGAGALIAANATMSLGHVDFRIAAGTRGAISLGFIANGTSLSAPDASGLAISTLNSGTINLAVVPEPASWVLLGIGTAGIFLSLLTPRMIWRSGRARRPV